MNLLSAGLSTGWCSTSSILQFQAQKYFIKVSENTKSKFMKGMYV
jgi:hypothetical protein